MGEKETVKVIVRCRPMNAREKDLKCKPCVFMDPKISQCSIVNGADPNAAPKTFTFDGTYYTDSTTEQIYNEIAYPLVEGVLEGYNGTVFAYGQTGCGKSFSMQGVKNPQTQRGIIPRAFEHIFEAIDASENMKYLVHGSYLEIYNEEIRDLLGNDIKKKLDLKEHPDKGVYVPELSLHPVHNVDECEALMERGWNNRATGSTLMNSESSRSHSIFTVSIEMMDMGMAGDQHIRKGKLNLVDLAGSERQAKTGATGDRLREANKINLSLSALGNVISALVDGKSKHIPYRDSKLTRLLQDSLGGNTKTMMVACLSPADNNYDETLSTLRYANRAKSIKNKPKINEDPKDAMLREYQDEISRLKQMLETQGPGGEGVPSEAVLAAERERVKKQYEHEMEELRTHMEKEKQTKAQMQKEIEQIRKDYEDKLKTLEERGKSATMMSARGQPAGSANVRTNDKGQVVQVIQKSDGTVVEQPVKKPINEQQQEAMLKLKQLQQEMIQGGKRAADKDLKERRQKKKKAAELRVKALGEALGHVDDEDGVLIKVYDDIQDELRVKTEALKKSKQKVKALNQEIRDLQQEFEDDRTDYLDTIRKQDQQLILLQQILDKIQPTIRKDSNYCNIEKIKQEAIWNDENQRWRIPDLVIERTKLPPPGVVSGNGGSSHLVGGPAHKSPVRSRPQQFVEDGPIVSDKPIPGAVQANGFKSISKGINGSSNGHHHVENDIDEVEDLSSSPLEGHLQQKLAQSEGEDVVGNYFKPKNRASRIVEQAQATQRAINQQSNKHLSTTQSNLGNSNLSSSFNSGLNTYGLNNSYGTSGSSSLNGSPQNGFGVRKTSTNETSSWHNSGPLSYGGPYASDAGNLRKPTRLEALPSMDRRNNAVNRKKSGPMLNTMGTF